MNTRLWLFAAPLLMAASVASAATPEEVYFTDAGSSYFSADNWEVMYVDFQNPFYAGSGIESVAALTGQDWVAISRLEAPVATFEYRGPGTGFLLNTLTIASAGLPPLGDQPLTVEISGYYNDTQVGSTYTLDLGKAAQTIELGWATEIDSFKVTASGGGTWALGSVNVTAVPEPESYAMLLAGLAIVGAVARRRRAFAHG